MSTFTAQIRAILAFIVLLGVGGGASLYRGDFELSRPPEAIGKIAGQIMASPWVGEAFVLRSRAPIAHGSMTDRAYFAPNVSEVHRLIELVKDDLPYTAEVYDCDDFSRHFKDQLLHRWAAEGNYFPLAVAEVYGLIELPNGEIFAHAWNAIVTDEGKVIYVEPQGPRAVGFSLATILAIMHVNF